MSFISRLIILGSTSFLLTCSPGNRNEIESGNKSDKIEFDSLKRNSIDVQVEEININLQQQGPPIKIPFQIYNPNDSLSYWTIEGKPSRISINFKFPDKHVWPTFFLKDGELILVRYRIWSMNAPAYASETISHIDNNEIIYCIERRMDLEPGAQPYLLREKEFNICTRSPADIHADYIPYWKTVKDFLITM